MWRTICLPNKLPRLLFVDARNVIYRCIWVIHRFCLARIIIVQVQIYEIRPQQTQNMTKYKLVRRNCISFEPFRINHDSPTLLSIWGQIIVFSRNFCGLWEEKFKVARVWLIFLLGRMLAVGKECDGFSWHVIAAKRKPQRSKNALLKHSFKAKDLHLKVSFSRSFVNKEIRGRCIC